ncbi:MAG: T9SS type A sorting domain-containing protein [Bacteroidota bacterium]
MYVAQWADGDIGDATNDVGGCDTTKNLGFIYNGSDFDSRAAQFGLPVAAVGYDLLQGPAVPGLSTDSVLWNFRYLRGKRAIPMTSYVVISPSPGDPFSPPTYATATGRWWQMLRGYAPTAFIVGDEDMPFPTPPGFNPVFSFPSDPESELTTGWLDGGAGAYTGSDSNGQSLSPGPDDRRMLLSSGPFLFAPGDTQEVIIATTAAFGFNRFNAVTELKRTNLLAQQDFDNGFQRSRPPAQPNVRYSELDGTVILEWGSDHKRALRTEERVVPVGGYEFEGYNIYQFPSAFAGSSEGRRIATFDVENGIRTVFERRYVYEYGAEADVPVQFGNDTGIRRYFVFDRDHLSGTAKLSNGTPYYLGISAYAAGPYTPGTASALESVPIRLTVRPQQPFGATLRAAIGDTIQTVTRTGGTSSVLLIPIVIDPTAIVPAAYDVTIDTTTMSYQSSQIPDTLVISRQDTVVRVAIRADESAPIFEGIQWKVTGTPEGADAFVVGTAFEAMVQDATAVAQSIEKVNVFPNPYFGMNPLETSAYRRFVTFNNLPQKARIRIFNLAGHLVRALDKDDTSQFLQWDLTNSNNFLVASGLYIAHLEFPDLQQSRILKLSIVQEHQVPGKH